MPDSHALNLDARSGTGGSDTGALLDERFLLLGSLGHGGMGRVVRAFDRHEERLVAIKFPKDAAGGGESHPLIDEFDVWSRLKHRNVVRAFGMGRARRGPLPPGTPYLILERFAGGPLSQSLPPGRTTPGQLASVAGEVLAALTHVHAAGFVHRDVKSSNILVRAGRGAATRAKLTDFGLAARAGRPGEFGRLSGCLAYVSPEAILGMPLDGRADLYALGIVLYRQAVGAHPSGHSAPDGLLRWHLGGTRPPPDIPLGSLPPRLSRFITRLLSPCRDERPASAAEALRLLGLQPPADALVRTVPAGRGELAALRLAIDACRRGARRFFPLPDDSAASAGLVREAWVRALSLGFDVHRLSGTRGGPDDLASWILRLLHFLGPGARDAAERHGLGERLPIGFIGGVPVRDQPRAEPPAEAGSRELARSARRVARFAAEAADLRPIVLEVSAAAVRDPFATAVLADLKRLCRPEGGTTDLSGGLLVLLPASYEQPLVDPQLTQT